MTDAFCADIGQHILAAYLVGVLLFMAFSFGCCIALLQTPVL